MSFAPEPKILIHTNDEENMNNDSVRDLVEELGMYLTPKEHSDVVLNNGKGIQFEIKPSEFSEIKPSSIRKIAFVDGGDGILSESPNYLITLNRVYFSIFRGKDRVKPKSKPRIQFFSYVVSDIVTEEKKMVRYNTRLFPYDKEDKHYLPLEEDLTIQKEAPSTLRSATLYSPRRFAEWKMGLHVVENELDAGDMIVMDGSLQTSLTNEIKYASRLYETAIHKKIIVCGLAKTSRLLTESGDPLLARIAEIAEDVPFGKWYVKVAEKVSADDRGFTLAVKFHEHSPYVYRFEILRDQYKQMDFNELNSVMYSLAANSQDLSMLGYPYGAIDADKFAQVRMDERIMYRGLVTTEQLKKSEWKKLQKYNTGLDTHDVLNGVTG